MLFYNHKTHFVQVLCRGILGISPLSRAALRQVVEAEEFVERAPTSALPYELCRTLSYLSLHFGVLEIVDARVFHGPKRALLAPTLIQAHVLQPGRVEAVVEFEIVLCRQVAHVVVDLFAISHVAHSLAKQTSDAAEGVAAMERALWRSEACADADEDADGTAW